MRIRSIKPEFWRSDDINSMTIEDRLLFIGLWSYVDDNGVGRDQEASIVADLFAHDLSVSPHDTLKRVHGGLKRLHALGVINRYEVENKAYIEIVNWSRHQRVNRPAEPRYPRSDADHAILSEPSVSPQHSDGAGTGEQGNRGTGYIPASADADADVSPPIEEQFQQWYAKYPRKKDRGHAIKAFKTAIKKTDLDTLMAGLDRYLAQIEQERTEPKHIAYPATWLNGERWDDETPPSDPERPKHPDAPDNRTVFEMTEEEFAERERIHRERIQAKRDAMASGGSRR